MNDAQDDMQDGPLRRGKDSKGREKKPRYNIVNTLFVSILGMKYFTLFCGYTKRAQT